jgi:hypothetical protein
MRRTVAATTVGLVLLPFALTACGSNDVKLNTAGSSTESTSPSTGTAAGTPTTGTAAGGGGAGHGAASACTAVRAELNVQKAGSVLLTLTNAGKRTCRVSGWTDVKLEAADKSTLAGHARKVNQPGAPLAIVLKPGRTAFAGLKWQPCDKASTSCLVASAVRVAAPGSAQHVYAAIHGVAGGSQRVTELTVKSGSLQVGTLQPRPDGVVAW